MYSEFVHGMEIWLQRRKYYMDPCQGAVIYISEFQNKLAWKFDISVSTYECKTRLSTQGS